jgi:type II secretory pathway pseudopilin PulG
MKTLHVHPRAGGRAHRIRPVRGSARGFTYLGVLVLVALLAAGAADWLRLWHVAGQREAERELLFVGHQFRQALASWNRHGHPGPRRLEDLLADPRTPGLRRHLRQVYPDPVTGRAEWGLVRDEAGGIVAVHSLSQAAPLKRTAFAAADRGFENAASYSEWVFAPRAPQPEARTP